MPLFETRQLNANDLTAYRALLIEGLARFPRAFLMTPDEAASISDEVFLASIAQGELWGGFDGTDLLAHAKLSRSHFSKIAHIGDLGPVYVAEASQGQGLSRVLMQAVLDAARDQGLLQIELCVYAGNTAAIRLYESLGFAKYGLHQRAVMTEGGPFDDLLMVKHLDGHSPA